MRQRSKTITHSNAFYYWESYTKYTKITTTWNIVLLCYVISVDHAHCLLSFIANVWKKCLTSWWSKVIDRNQWWYCKQIAPWLIEPLLRSWTVAAMQLWQKLSVWSCGQIVDRKQEWANIPICPDQQPVVVRKEEEGACGIKSEEKQQVSVVKWYTTLVYDIMGKSHGKEAWYQQHEFHPSWVLPHPQRCWTASLVMHAPTGTAPKWSSK